MAWTRCSGVVVSTNLVIKPLTDSWDRDHRQVHVALRCVLHVRQRRRDERQAAREFGPSGGKLKRDRAPQRVAEDVHRAEILFDDEVRYSTCMTLGDMSPSRGGGDAPKPCRSSA